MHSFSLGLVKCHCSVEIFLSTWFESQSRLKERLITWLYYYFTQIVTLISLCRFPRIFNQGIRGESLFSFVIDQVLNVSCSISIHLFGFISASLFHTILLYRLVMQSTYNIFLTWRIHLVYHSDHRKGKLLLHREKERYWIAMKLSPNIMKWWNRQIFEILAKCDCN